MGRGSELPRVTLLGMHDSSPRGREVVGGQGITSTRVTITHTDMTAWLGGRGRTWSRGKQPLSPTVSPVPETCPLSVVAAWLSHPPHLPQDHSILFLIIRTTFSTLHQEPPGTTDSHHPPQPCLLSLHPLIYSAYSLSTYCVPDSAHLLSTYCILDPGGSAKPENS